MSNCYTLITAAEKIPCSKADFKALQKVWEPVGYDDDGFELPSSGLILELKDGKLFIFSEESGDESCIPEAALKVLGDIIAKADKEALEFGYACYSDRTAPGSTGGGNFRVTASGELEQAITAWGSFEREP